MQLKEVEDKLAELAKQSETEAAKVPDSSE